MARYKVGLEPGVKSWITARNPSYAPIVDTKSPFAFGIVVALVDNKALAQKIVDLLNDLGADKFPTGKEHAE